MCIHKDHTHKHPHTGIGTEHLWKDIIEKKMDKLLPDNGKSRVDKTQQLINSCSLPQICPSFHLFIFKKVLLLIPLTVSEKWKLGFFLLFPPHSYSKLIIKSCKFYLQNICQLHQLLWQILVIPQCSLFPLSSVMKSQVFDWVCCP